MEKEIYLGCDALRRANRHSESGVNSAIQEIRKQRDSLPHSRMADIEKQMLERIYSYDIDFSRDMILNLVRASMTVVVFGFLEALLKKIVINLNSPFLSKRQKHEIIKKRYKVINNCVRLLENDALINVPSFFNSELELVTNIRNAYAHNSGVLRRTETTKIKRLVNKVGGSANVLTGFRINKAEPNIYTIEFFSEFVEAFIEKVEDSLNDILGQLRQRI